MVLVAALVFQRFDVTLDDPSYELVIKQTLTIKPKDFRIRVALRADRAPPLPRPSTFSARSVKSTNKGAGAAGSGRGSPAEPKQPVYVMYGSNTGTSETFAQRIVNDAAARGMPLRWVYARVLTSIMTTGFRASMGTLDSYAGKLPTDGPVVIITASFEGPYPPLPARTHAPLTSRYTQASRRTTPRTSSTGSRTSRARARSRTCASPSSAAGTATG